MKSTPLYAVLAYAGAMPFIACALLLAAGIAEIPYLASTAFVAASYSLAIVAFMSGSHWATWQHREHDDMPALLPWSNALTLIMWFALLLTPAPIAVLAAVVCFAALLLLDRRLCALEIISQEYFRVRRNVTAVVIASLLITAWLGAGR